MSAAPARWFYGFSASTPNLAVANYPGAVTIGAPTGGDQGAGSLNVQSLYVNGVAVTGGSGTAAQFIATEAITGSATQGAFANGTLSFSDTCLGTSIQSSTNGYVQNVIQNTSNGTAASSDLIVANNISTATTTYGDFGINSSTFTGSGSFNLANATYAYAAGGDLVLGTITSNGVHFVVNNGATDAGAISSAGAWTIGSAGLAVGTTGISTTGPVSGVAGTFTGQLQGLGTATNNNATAGQIGEYVQSIVASGSAVTMVTSGVPINVTTISLTAGDWDVRGTVVQSLGTGASVMQASINTTSVTQATLGNPGTAQMALAFSGAASSLTLSTVRLSLASTTTVYLVSQQTYTSGTPGAYGNITARRVR